MKGIINKSLYLLSDGVEGSLEGAIDALAADAPVIEGREEHGRRLDCFEGKSVAGPLAVVVEGDLEMLVDAVELDLIGEVIEVH